MESLTVAETETEDDSASIDIEGKLQSTAESTNNIVKNCMSIYNTYSVDMDADAVFAKPMKASSAENEEAAKAKHGMFYISDYILHENK